MIATKKEVKCFVSINEAMDKTKKIVPTERHNETDMDFNENNRSPKIESNKNEQISEIFMTYVITFLVKFMFRSSNFIHQSVSLSCIFPSSASYVKAAI